MLRPARSARLARLQNIGAVKSVIRISPAGDIGMGDFSAGTNPNP